MEEKEEHYKKYGWKCNEDNLKTLPKTAPEAVKSLAEWLTLEGRRSSLEEWINQVEDDGRIHAKFWHIGAWTQRMSHSSPNLANISAVWPEDKEPETPVEKVKAKYDSDCRSLFMADHNAWLVGCDAEGIQLRILAHYMQSEEYVEAILKGDKKFNTDIHSVNKRALGSICKSRDDAKTFVYAWLLGAGIAKVASILGCSQPEAKRAIDSFLTSLPELKTLKTKAIPHMVAKGGFTGLDGRFVRCNSNHLMLAGMLQSGEAIVMKHANVLWYHQAKAEGIRFKQVNFVHDEWQTVVYGSREDAVRMGEIQANAIYEVGHKLELYCPLAGTPKIGFNWKETH